MLKIACVAGVVVGVLSGEAARRMERRKSAAFHLHRAPAIFLSVT